MQEQVEEELKLFYSPLLCAWRESTRRDSFPACAIYQNVSRETFLSDRDLKSYKANDSGLSQVCKIGRFFGVIGIGRHWRHEDLTLPGPTLCKMHRPPGDGSGLVCRHSQASLILVQNSQIQLKTLLNAMCGHDSVSAVVRTRRFRNDGASGRTRALVARPSRPIEPAIGR
jgi:hypothetical protein